MHILSSLLSLGYFMVYFFICGLFNDAFFSNYDYIASNEGMIREL
jgi:hypothetical protein